MMFMILIRCGPVSLPLLLRTAARRSAFRAPGAAGG